MAKRKKAEKEMINQKSDLMENILIKSSNDAIKGIGPKNQKQNSVGDIFGDTLEVYSGCKKVDNANALTGTLNWEDIKSIPKNNMFSKKPIEEWSSKNIYGYFKGLYKDKYNRTFTNIGECGGLEAVRKTREVMAGFMGDYPSMYCMKAYIDWFMEHEVDSSVAKKGEFYISSLKNKISIRRFLKNYEEPVIPSVKEENKKEEPIIDLNDMELMFKTSKMSFLIKFGIINGMAWLVFNKHLSIEKAKKIIEDVLKDMKRVDEHSITKVAKATKDMSPYPISYKFDCSNDLLDIIKEKDVQFLSNAALRS